MPDATTIHPKESTPLTAAHSADDGGGALPLCGGCATIRSRRRASLLTVTLVFFSLVMVASTMMTLPTALPALKRRDDIRDSVVVELPFVGGFFYAVGKALSIAANYHLGPRGVLVYIQGLLGAAFLVIFTVDVGALSWVLLYVGWSGASLAIAHGWSASCRIAACWVDAEHVGRTMSLFGIAMDAGGAGAAFVFSWLVDGSWRAPFWLAAGCLVALAATLELFLRSSSIEVGFRPPRAPAVKSSGSDAGAQPLAKDDAAESASGGSGGGAAPAGGGGAGVHPLDALTPWQAALVLLRCPRVWLATLACSGYGVVFAATTTYLPLYATERLGASDGDAARLLTFALVGALLGDLGGGPAMDALRPSSAVALTLGLNGVGAAAMIVWFVLEVSPGDAAEPPYAVVAGVSTAISLGVAWSWNVWVGAFQMRHGGPTHSATLTAVMDIASIALRVPGFLAVGLFATHGEWASTVAVLVALLLLGHALMAAFLVSDLRLGGALPRVDR